VNEITEPPLDSPNSKVARPVGRYVRCRTDTSGEDVDVLLNTLVRVVDGFVDKQIPVVRLAVEPVVGEVAVQPNGQEMMNAESYRL